LSFQWQVVTDNIGLLRQGALVTVMLTCVTMALAIPGGLLLAGLRLSPWAPVRIAATAFVEFFRATPLILQLYWTFYVLPAFFDVRLSEWSTAIVGLTCNISSFNAETFRAGIRSIRQGQWNAGRALGMGDLQIFFRIVLPQAVMRVLPALATTWVSLFKDTSLVSVIAVADLSYVSLRLRAETYRILEVLTAMAALYWLMGYPQAKLCDWIHRRYRVVE
jgi:His/Glu/Gln/Arg/opine family amino acid ABC transporter permease subunit